MKLKWLVLLTAFLGAPVLAQDFGDMILQTAGPKGEGWDGFYDWHFLINASANLLLAAVLGAAIAYHPRHLQTADTFEEIEATQIYILYAVIGSITGILVVQYGMAVGFVLFGIGALIRFRTVLRSASLTGRLIFAVLRPGFTARRRNGDVVRFRIDLLFGCAFHFSHIRSRFVQRLHCPVGKSLSRGN